MKPHIALVGSNQLMMIGLRSMLEKLIPFADITIFPSVAKMQALKQQTTFFHFFVSFEALEEAPVFFQTNKTKTILLSQGETAISASKGFRCLDVMLNEDEILKQLLLFQQYAHHGYTKYPQALARHLQEKDKANAPLLSPRETDVLRLLAKGLINKEIADRLCISINTVITHRKNIMQKLHSQSLSKLVIYAVQHGLVEVSEIS